MFWEQTFISFKDSLRKKTTNPFLGTYFTVFLARNWELFYSVFTFDAEYKLLDRIGIINQYLEQKSLWQELGQNLLLTFLLLIATYFFINVARLITNLYERKLTPWIHKITDKNSVVLKSEFALLSDSYTKLDGKFKEEKKIVTELRKEIDDLEQETSSSASVLVTENKRLQVELRDAEAMNDSLNDIISLSGFDGTKEASDYKLFYKLLGITEFRFNDLKAIGPFDDGGQMQLAIEKLIRDGELLNFLIAAASLANSDHPNSTYFRKLSNKESGYLLDSELVTAPNSGDQMLSDYGYLVLVAIHYYEDNGNSILTWV